MNTTWTVRYASPSEQDRWDELVAQNPDGGSFLQTVAMARIKQASKWKPLYLIYEKADQRIAALALTRSIFPIGDIWYMAKSPGITSPAELKQLCTANRQFVKQHQLNVFLIKLEPPLLASSQVDQAIADAGLMRSHSIQPSTSTIIIDIKNNPHDQLLSLGRRARRYIRRGIREGIQVKQVAPTEANFQLMYQLMKTVSGGRGVPGIRAYDYYKKFWNQFIHSGHGKLYFAYEDGWPTVGVFVITLGKKAVYKDGGSAPGRDSKGASYLIQWHIMNQLSNEGVTTYDLWGSPPSARIDDSTHFLHGVGVFKTAFTKEITDYCGVLDQVVSSKKYRLWCKLLYPLIDTWYRYRSDYFY